MISSALYLGGEMDFEDLTLSGEVDTSGAGYGVKVLRGPRPGWAPSDIDARMIAGRHGGTAGAAWYQRLQLDFTLLLTGTTHADAQDKMDLFRRLLSRDRAAPRTLRWGLSNMGDRFWLAQHEAIDAPEEVGLSRRFRASFVSADPRAWGIDRVTQVKSITANPTTFNAPDEGFVAGTADTEPIWIIEAGAGGAASVELENETTGQIVNYGAALNDGDQIRIDAGLRRIVEKSTDGGTTWASAMGDVTITQRMPLLWAGVQNELKVSGIGAGTVTAVYRARYW